MSKNVVDTIIQFSLQHPEREYTFIPSRRQIEHDGGYVNKWNTEDFVKYVKSNNSRITIERDHGGPNQGLIEDDGMESMTYDAKLLDIIHIDPWKRYTNIDEGIAYTIKMMNHCHEINPNVFYEICTEEAIRPFSVDEIEYVVLKLRESLSETIFNKIKYLVIQCGTRLLERQNTGEFDENKLISMLDLAKKYNMIAKEHNGDWVSLSTIQRKYEIGLTCINIAPEFGEIESRVILNRIKQSSSEDYECLYKICLESGKWRKWVSSDFDYENNKDDIILTCGHYNFTNHEFLKIKEKYPNIDTEIHDSIYDKLLELYGFDKIYSVRKSCIFCNNTDLELLFNHSNYKQSLSLSVYDEIKDNPHFMPYNVQICKLCNSFQNKYIGNLSIIYGNNHVDNYGTTKTKKHTLLTSFITENTNIHGIIEIGSCNGILARNILETVNTPYTIIEPSYTGNKEGIHVIETYFENVDLINIDSNTIVMSDVFEHFYNPTEILCKIRDSKNIQFVYLSHPDFDYSIKKYMLTNLNCEHTFLIQHDFLFQLFKKYGFQLKKRYDYENYSLFLEFERIETVFRVIDMPIINNTLYHDAKLYFKSIMTIVDNMNKYINENPSKKIYIWPTSVHSITLFTCGLQHYKLSGILDNSPNKIGKYLYGYNLQCSSFNDAINNNDPNTFIIISGAGNYIKELELNHSNIKYLEDFMI
jgi:hypothetical protein